MIRIPLTHSVTALAIALSGARSAHALEPLKAYDSFTGTSINSTLWGDGERTRAVKAGQLNLMQRSFGSTLSNTGVGYFNFDEHFINPTEITAIRAKITVTSVAANACGGNSAVTQSRARVISSLFNSATPVPGSQLNDVIAQVRLTRFSNSTDPAGVLRVQGVMTLCTTSDCNSATTINTVDLGTVTLGTAAVVQFQWDKASKTVFFSRDSGVASGAITYALSDANAPGLPFAALSTRMEVASCLSSTPIEGSVNALFDNPAVNRSAAP